MILGGGTTDLAERDEIMKMFWKHQINFVISTNVISRGIDIPGLSFVLNFDPPYIKDKDGFYIAQPEQYLHKIGRTGWFGTRGVALTLIDELDYDKEWKVMEEIKNKYEIHDLVVLHSAKEVIEEYTKWVYDNV